MNCVATDLAGRKPFYTVLVYSNAMEINYRGIKRVKKFDYNGKEEINVDQIDILTRTILFLKVDANNTIINDAQRKDMFINYTKVNWLLLGY